MEPLLELKALITRHVASGQTNRTLPGVRITASTVPTEPIHHVSEPAFALVIQGAKQIVLGEKVFEYGAGKCLVVSVDLPIAGRVVKASVSEPYLALVLVLKPTAIATLLLETAASESVATTVAGLGVNEASPDLLEAVVRLLRLLDKPKDITVLQPMVEREILWRLLASELGGMVRQIGLADSRLSRIGQAIRWIRAHYEQTIRIEELARISAMSVSSFHRHFKAISSMSPLQYQKQIRLQEARTRLLERDQDIAVVGANVGYDSPSQFSREYRRLFGAPPGRDVARLRTRLSIDRSVI